MKNMKISQHKKSKKNLAIVLLVILIVALCIGGYYVFAKVNDKQTKKETTTENTILPENKVDQTKPYEESKKSTSNSDPQAPTAEDEETGKTIVSVVTTSNISDGTLYIRGGINNTVSTDGTCFAQLTGPSGTSIRKDTVILGGASTADCKTIQIPTSELSPGSWSYTLNYSSQNYEGVSNEAAFVIK